MADIKDGISCWVWQHTPQVPDTQEAGTGGSLEPKQQHEMCGWGAQWLSVCLACTRPWVQSPPSKLYKTLQLLQLHVTRPSATVAAIKTACVLGFCLELWWTLSFSKHLAILENENKVEAIKIILSWRHTVYSASSTNLWDHLSWCLCAFRKPSAAYTAIL